MKIELKIVALLARDAESSYTINRIAKELKQHYSFVNRVVSRLSKENVVVRKKIGNAYSCSLNMRNEKTFTLLSLSEIERYEEFYRKNKRLGLMLEDFVKSMRGKNNTISVVLFGSRAKGLAGEKSDIDLLLIVKRKFPVEREIREIYAKYGVEISALLLTPDEFTRQKDRDLIKEIMKNHYVLCGAENFVNLVFK